MPKIDNPRPAAVYAPGDGTALRALYPLLLNRRLYMLDDRTETIEDLALPVVDRPILRMHLFHARMGCPSWAEVLIADHLTSLGSDERECVAVVGAFLQLGREVIVAGAELGSDWYRGRIARVGYAAVGPLIDDLLSTKTWPITAWEQWAASPKTSHQDILPTSLCLNYKDARLRVKELVELGGMTKAGAADQVMVEGYPNADDRRIWYPQAVRDALEQGL